MTNSATIAKPKGSKSNAKPKASPASPPVIAAELTISSKNYSSWSLRGWLLCRMAGIPFDEVVMPSDDPSTKAELLLMSPSFLVPRLTHNGISIWDTLAIAEYLYEIAPEAKMFPADPAARAHCRSIAGEMHSGFANMRSALPMNIKAHYPSFRIWAGAQADIDRIVEIWRDCLTTYGGPFLFGEPTVADAMYAPVCSRFVTYTVPLDDICAQYRDRILALPYMQDWIGAAQLEEDELDELEAEF